MKTALTALAASFVLAGCGGGGRTDLAEAPAYTPMAFTPDTIIVSDIVVRADGLDLRVTADCEGTQCQFTFAGQTETFDGSDIIDIDSESAPPEVSERLNGIGLFEERVEDSFFGVGIDATLLGAWMESSAFVVTDIAVDESDMGELEVTIGAVLGDSPRTNPAARGGGTWAGAMVGTDTHASETVKGHAAIRIRDFSDPAADVAFTRVRAPSGPRTDMTWTGLAIENGTFSSTSIHGTFFGERHTEVAGTFERDRVIGAFGARRP